MRKISGTVIFFCLVVEMFCALRVGAAESVEFVDVAVEVGIDFEHVNCFHR